MPRTQKSFAREGCLRKFLHANFNNRPRPYNSRLNRLKRTTYEIGCKTSLHRRSFRRRPQQARAPSRQNLRDKILIFLRDKRIEPGLRMAQNGLNWELRAILRMKVEVWCGAGKRQRECPQSSGKPNRSGAQAYLPQKLPAVRVKSAVRSPLPQRRFPAQTKSPWKRALDAKLSSAQKMFKARPLA
jgi:hypothetical protein